MGWSGSHAEARERETVRLARERETVRLEGERQCGSHAEAPIPCHQHPLSSAGLALLLTGHTRLRVVLRTMLLTPNASHYSLPYSHVSDGLVVVGCGSFKALSVD
jgi:hypothetical protein